MLITIFLLILIYSLQGKPIDKLLNKVKDANWNELATKAWTTIRSFGLKAGRVACKPLLYFYYVLKDERTTLSDKALIYGAILYIASPFDLLPRRVLGLLGILDDAAVTAFVLKKIRRNITPEIESKVMATIEEWFGTGATAEPLQN